MKRLLVTSTIIPVLFIFSVSAQDTTLPSDSTVQIIHTGMDAETTLFPAELEILLKGMVIENPAEEILPQYDRDQLEIMRRKLLDDMPKYPALRLWDNQVAYPFLYSSRSRFAGLDMAGLATHIKFTPWLSADVSAYLSGAYMGQYYPKRYLNASLSSTVRLKLHDRIYLLGMGEISAREGLHPKVAPGIGGKNSLGTGVEIWITNNLGISFSRTWEYYRGSWYGHYNYGPVMRQGTGR